MKELWYMVDYGDPVTGPDLQETYMDTGEEVLMRALAFTDAKKAKISITNLNSQVLPMGYVLREPIKGIIA